ncbi:MAG: B12-binding domain-containing radical SAM protein, partial [Promethearchaeota archaeon]
MKNPPVIPIGLEYLITTLEKHGHIGDILDLCFENSPIKKLEKTLIKNSYDLVGFTIRNIDSAIFFNNEFFLPEIKKLVQCAKNYKIPVILGGSGFSAMPNEILNYLEADFGIIGPAEVILPRFLKQWQTTQRNKKIFNGWKYGIDVNLIHYKRGEKFDYPRYLAEEGIIGFETHVGCPNLCPYCIEANTQVYFKKIPNIIEELKYLVNQGYNHFHTCDTEFNTDLKFSIKFCEALIEHNLNMKWALYMKPYPYSEDLFRLLHESNAYLITLSVDSDERIQTLNNYSYKDLAKIIEYCNKYKIDLAIDLLTGYLNESIESTKKCLNFFENNPPKTVGISFYYRIYKNTELAKLIQKNPKLQIDLITTYSNEKNYLYPIFYNNLKQQILEELISGKELFRIAGITPGVNYQL